MAKGHSPWGMSGLYRYKLCGKAARYSAWSANNDSEFSIEGHNAHALAEATLRNPTKSVQQVKDLLFGKVELEPSSIAGVRTYVRHVRQLLLSEPDPWLFVEVDFEFDLPEVPVAQGKVWGRADCVIYFPTSKTLYVIDYKNGVGVDVEAEDNDQIMGYALGVMQKLNLGVERVVLQIVQPRSKERDGEPVKSWETDALTIFNHRQTIIDAINHTLENGDRGVPGDHCHFCAGDGLCEETARDALTLAEGFDVDNLQPAEAEFPLPEPNRLDDWQLAAIFNNSGRVRQFLKAVESQIFQRIMAGAFQSDDVKLVRGTTNRVWAKGMSQADIMMELMEAGLPLAETYVLEVLSPAQSEEALAEHLEGKELLEAKRDLNIRCFEKAPGALRVVPKSHRGVAVQPAVTNAEGLAGLLPPPQ